ncbi:chymotrypsin-C-like [Daphnia pulex]|uniref:chymotrypsin-C-like n=1 Tax=Daphnia pulex TaxID=6669 RepID=UPI001EDCD012|nr:chymotrypsin-C-like [Daphnia pulex]
MMGDQKGFLTVIVVAVVTLLSCCSPASSFLLPRVTRTSDAIIIDYDGLGYAPLEWKYGNVAKLGFIPMSSSFNPYYAMMYGQEQQPMMFDAAAFNVGEQGVKQSITTTTPPAIQCGRGPATMPAARSPINERIIEGVSAKKNAWPFMVYVSISSKKCGGVLISDSKVLLAAQCLERFTLFDTLLSSTVSIGVYSIDPLDAQMTRRISNIILHSQFNAASFANDIAIITLDAPVVLSKTVVPVCLPPESTDPDQYADQDAIILGWDASEVLQQGKVKIASNVDCKNMQSISQYVSDTTICLSSTTVFPCNYDMGGPVVIQSSTGAWTVVGINSYVTPDCDASGLQTRVSAFSAWIDKYMKLKK